MASLATRCWALLKDVHSVTIAKPRRKAYRALKKPRFVDTSARSSRMRGWVDLLCR